jgi:signal transduction histidine kinase/ligand-binding sensor domain-containing protein/CheY-like chemotaxis protein
MARLVAEPPVLPVGRFVRISEEEGLAHSDVRAIAQDRVGFMWFGLRLGGLTRYDGYEFKVYRHVPDDPTSLGNQIIWCLRVDRGGVLWIGTEGGLDRYVRASDSFIHYRAEPGRADRLPNNVITCIFEDAGGRLWVGSRGGLSRLDDPAQGTFTTYRRPPVVPGSPSTDTIRSITEDPATGLLWLGTSDGVAAFDPRTGAFATYLNDPADPTSLSCNPVNRVMRDEHGVMWALTEGGLNAFEPTLTAIPTSSVQRGSVAFRRYVAAADKGHPLNFFRDGLVDRKGRFWLATRGGALLLDRDTGAFTVYRRERGDPSSLSDNYVHTVFEDRSGSLWLGTYAGGVNRLHSELKPFRIHRFDPASPQSLSDDRVTALTFDGSGRLWASTVNGLSRYEAGQWTRFAHADDDPASLPGNDLSTVLALPNGNLLIGSGYGGIYEYDGRRFRAFPTIVENVPAPSGRHPFTGSQVNSLLPDGQGGVWIGCRAYGLDHLSDGTFQHYAPRGPGAGMEAQPTSNPVLGMVEPNGDLWFATELSGLIHLDAATNRFTAYAPPVERPGATRSLHCLVAGDDGVIWVGAADGLLKFDRRTRRFVGEYAARDGLPDPAVMTLVRDRRGHLWVGTAGGLADLDPATGRIRSYEKADGLPSNVFAQRAGALGPDGRVYLGTRAGIVEFMPGELAENPVPPPVVLTELRWIGEPPLNALGQRLPATAGVGDVIRVAPGQLGFSLRFSALDFAAPEKNRFRYKLEGWEPDWTKSPARERTATYTSLPPGTYVFRVQASNGDQVWNRQGASVRIIVEPHLWQTLWFRVLLVAAGVATLGALLNWRVRAVRRRNLQLELKVAIRTEQLNAEIAVRQKAEAALRQSHAELEDRVRERTAELAQANENLQAEAASRRQVEAQLRQAQKMEAIGLLAGGIAHDFNNLLTVILGQSELLTEAELSPSERVGAVRDIRAAAQRATNLTRQLLVFSRRQAMSPAPLDLNEVVVGVTKLLRHMIGERIQLEMRLAAEPLCSLADAGMIEQVLLNMAVNARDAMPRGGRLTIRTEAVVVDAAWCARQPRAKPGAYGRISVSDTGYGIAEAALPQIFDPFFTTKESGKGTGLGLAISLGIVLQHGGWIDVDTAVGRGTTFHVYLPLKPVTPHELPAEPVRATRRGSGTVLVAEDDAAVRLVVERILGRAGFRILHAANGAEALRLWAQHHATIDVLLSDVVMPGHPDGHELAHELSRQKPSLRVVLMSGYDPTETAAPTGRAQPQLRKPFTTEDLLKALGADAVD